MDEIFNKTAEEAVKELTDVKVHNIYEKSKNEIEVSKHDIYDIIKHSDRTVAGKKIPRNRIGLNLQQKIVEAAVAFLFKNKVLLKSTEESDFTNLIDFLLDKNKIYSFNRKIARTLFTDGEVAEYWYPVESKGFWDGRLNSNVRYRVTYFAPSNQNTLYPYFDEYRDLKAFSRKYTRKDDVEVLDVWTDKWIAKYVNKEKWELESLEKNRLEKIPIIYYRQEKSEWSDQQHLIERVEKLLSNLADTNDYFGSPLIAVNGKVLSLPEKQDDRKVIELQGGADIKYLTWDNAPAAVELEYNLLMSQIFYGSSTPNVSFDNIKGINNTSGIALQLMFEDAHMKADNKLEVFDEMFARRISILKRIVGLLSGKEIKEDVWLEITPYLPKNRLEELQMLFMLSGGQKLVSQRTGVASTGFVEDADKEMEQIDLERIKELGESYR